MVVKRKSLKDHSGEDQDLPELPLIVSITIRDIPAHKQLSLRADLFSSQRVTIARTVEIDAVARAFIKHRGTRE
jgi:hypothetical protein